VDETSAPKRQAIPEYLPQRRKVGKSEIQISKPETNNACKQISNIQIEIQNIGCTARFEVPSVCHLNLFRISDFVLRIFFILGVRGGLAGKYPSPETCHKDMQ
jgi:hypothetical protein